MTDKILKKEQRQAFRGWKVRRVQSYGLGKYKKKEVAIPYWVKDRGCFVTYPTKKALKLEKKTHSQWLRGERNGC